MRRLAVLLVDAAMVAACSHGPVEGSAPKPAETTPVPVNTAAPVPLSQPVLGVNLYAPSNYPAAAVEVDGKRMLAYIKNVLNADAVGIVWNFYAPDRQSDAVEANANTLTAGNVAILTRIALQDHLQVEYRPVIVVNNAPNSWEGFIDPANPVAWFASYYRAELPYLQTAQQYKISEFVASTEMYDLDTSPLWAHFFIQESGVYHGVISYAGWDGTFFSRDSPLLPVHYLGVDMYYHFKDLPETATAAQVTAAWERVFAFLPASVLARTAIDETGIAARAGAYADPPALQLPGVLDEEVQANWYIAACNTVNHYHMRGVFFWKVDLSDHPAHPAASMAVFEGKEGAAAISECAQILR
jgi:hypothetical protein